jgi:hypothetical protein
VGRVDLRFTLRISRCENGVDYSGGKRFRLAVVDLDRAKDYPLNFVCMLPLRIDPCKREVSAFVRFFGDKSLELAKELLVDALKAEDDSDVKVEIERRLKLLDPESACEKTCVSCGKIFQADPKKKSKQRFCEACLRRRFGDRN